MKVTFIVDHFGNGGAERVVSVLSDTMIKMGHDVYIIVSKNIRNYELNESVKYFVAENESNNIVIRRIQKVIAIRRLLQQLEPDIVFSFGYYMNLYAIAASIKRKRRKFRLVISERTDPKAEPTSKILRGLRNQFYKEADLLVCQTQQAKEYFSKKQQTKTFVIPNPIKSDLPNMVIKKRKKVIVTACRLEKQKNIPLLLRAFKRILSSYPDYKLIIYGDGSLRKELIEMACFLGIESNVEFPGFVTDIYQKMIDASMYVSSSDYEGISNSMLEAMGMGIPIICTDCPVGGAAMAIHHMEDGLLVPVNNENELANAMLYYLNNPEEANKYGENAKKVNIRFNVNRIAEMWLELM